eukprot:1178828-Pleurochrysis_carterae.AAC.1
MSFPSTGNARWRLVQVARVVTGLDTTALEFSADTDRKFFPRIDRLKTCEIPGLRTVRRSVCAAV